MAEFIQFKVDENGAFRAALDRAKAVVKDLKQPFNAIADDFFRTQGEFFALSGPGPFPDLKPRYKVRKQAIYGFAYPILRAGGSLEAAATGGSGSVREIGELEAVFGVDERQVPHAVYHNSDAPRSKIPLRKFVFVGPEAPQFAIGEQKTRVDRWKNILNDYVLQRLALAGLGQVKT